MRLNNVNRYLQGNGKTAKSYEFHYDQRTIITCIIRTYGYRAAR